MNWTFTPYAVPLFVSSVVLIVLAIAIWRRRTMRGAIYFFWLCLALSWYVFSYAFELGSTSLDDVEFWLRMEYLGLPFASALLLMFVLGYTGHQHVLTPSVKILMLIPPVMSSILAMTNGAHGLVWHDMVLDRSHGFTGTIFTRGAWGWYGHVVYSYVILASAGIVLVRAFWKATGLYRRQLSIPLLGMGFGWAASILYVSGLTPHGLDVTSYGFSITAMIIADGLFRYHMLDVMPVAREVILASITDAILIVDTQHRVIDLNTAALELLDTQLPIAIGKPFSSILPPPLHILNQYLDQFEHAEQITLELVSKVWWYELHHYPLWRRSDQLAGHLMMLRDITARKQIEEAEYEQRQLAEALRDTAAVLNSTLAVDSVLNHILENVGRVVPHNTANIMLIDRETQQARIVASQGYELYGLESWVKTFSVPITDPAYFVYEIVHNKQPVIIADLRGDPRAGSVPETEWIQSYVGAPLCRHDQVIGILNLDSPVAGFFTPAHAENLKAFADQASLALENADLYQALEKHARELAVMVDELDAYAHTVAHDLKNPLMVLGNYSMLLKDEFDTLSREESIQMLDVLISYSQKMTNITDELLLLAGLRKLDSIHAQPLDMAAIVAAAHDRLVTLENSKQATITVPDTWPGAVGYAPWVEEIWANYLSNAIKYGGDAPTIELGAVVQPDGLVRFWVRDHGPGLTEAEQANLFAEFTQLHAVSRVGYGLGLSIVKRISEKLGGTVGVESAVGQGCTFYFTLPGV